MVPELQARCAERYEAGRRAQAVWRVSAMLVAVGAIALGEVVLGYLRVGVVVTCAALLAGVVFWASVRGQAAWRGARLGGLAGLLPLGCALGAERVGMVCTPAGCSSLCVPVCAASGLVAAAIIWRCGAGRGVEYWWTAGAAATLVGAMGCACVSFTGAFALAAAMVLTLGAGAMVTARA